MKFISSLRSRKPIKSEELTTWLLCKSSKEFISLQVCQLLMSKKIFEPVKSRHNDSSKASFEDSSGKLYCFTEGTGDPENMAPPDDSDDDSLYDENDNQPCLEHQRYGVCKPREEN